MPRLSTVSVSTRSIPKFDLGAAGDLFGEHCG